MNSFVIRVLPSRDTLASPLRVGGANGSQLRQFCDGLIEVASSEFSNKSFHDANNMFVKYSGVVLLNGKVVQPNELLDIALSRGSLVRWVNRLSGQFALAIGNLREGVVEVARDRGGFHPCFVASHANAWSFATSPVDAAAAIGRAQPNDNVLARYVGIRYDNVWGAQETFLTGVSSVPPASSASSASGREVSRYWSFAHLDPDIKDSESDESVVELNLLLREAARNSLDLLPAAARPVLALSGGMDSTTTAAALKSCGADVPSVTASYKLTGDSPLDESRDAEAIAGGLCSSWEALEISSHDFLGAWEEVGKRHAFPLATSAQLGLSMLYERVSAMGFTHLFVGGASDDLFAGNYPAYLYNLADLYVRQKDAFAHELRDWVTLHSTDQFRKGVGPFWDFFRREVDSVHYGRIAPKSQLLAPDLVRPEGMHALGGEDVVIDAPSYLQAYMAYGIWHSARPPGVLSLHEAASQSSVQVVDIFSGEALLRFAWALPSAKKIFRGQNKWILRQAMADKVPVQALKRSQKQGFDVPFGEWMTNETYRRFVLETIQSNEAEFLDEFFDLARLRRRVCDTSFPPLPNMFIWQTVSAIRWRSEIVEQS